MQTDALVSALRSVGADLHSVEVKTAVGGLPSAVAETVSAFANGNGGILILGLDENAGFTAAAGFDAAKIRDALAGACEDRMNPPLRVPIEIEEFEGAQVVRADVPELDPVAKPCFVEARGAYQGSFIRGDDGDRQLTHYEVTQLLANRTQPTFDLEVVEGATLDDLDDALVGGLLALNRHRSPQAFGDLGDVDALVRLGAALRRKGDQPRPTVAGLICLGEYPQQFFPQLFVSFVSLPGLRMGQRSPDGARFLDNQTITGPIPTMVADTVAAMIRNMRCAAVIRGIGREDRYDYPLDVVQELVVNALLHRDYSSQACGAQVQVELYADRLVIKNPGGLYGGVSVDMLGSDDSVMALRNRALAGLLADLPLPHSGRGTLCESRGSGLPHVMESLRQAGMSPPAFDAAPGRVKVTVPQQALLSPDTIEWSRSLGTRNLTDTQRLALAMMRNAGRATTPMLQAWGVDSPSASQALRALADCGLAARSGGGRYASYQLGSTVRLLSDVLSGSEGRPGASSDGVEAQRDVIVRAIQAGNTTARGLAEALGINYRTVMRRLAELVGAELIEPTRPARSSRQTYRLVHPEEQR